MNGQTDPHTLLVTTDWDRSFAAAVEAGGYKIEDASSNVTEGILPPRGGTGRTKTEITLLPPSQPLRLRYWMEALNYRKESRQKFAHPLSVLAIYEEHPEEEGKYPIFTIWKDGAGRFWSLEISGAYHRSLCVFGPRRDDIEIPGQWGAQDDRAAVVDK